MKVIIKLILFVFFGLFISSCGKKGCTDSQATNYCEKCKRNDGSCVYQSQCIFWHNKATNDSLIAHGKTYLFYAVNGIIIKQYFIQTSVSNSPPECKTIGMATTERSLKNDGSHMEYYEIIDNSSNVLWNGYIDFNANSPCIILQQEWKP